MRGRCDLCGFPFDREDLIDGICWDCIQNRDIDTDEDVDFCRRLEQGFELLSLAGDWEQQR